MYPMLDFCHMVVVAIVGYTAAIFQIYGTSDMNLPI